MLLLGVVIEKITGESYFDFIQDHIYTPAGMHNSGAFEADEVIPNLAMGYSRMETSDEIVWRKDNVKLILKGSPSGGSYSTADDLTSFDTALRNHILLRPDSVKTVQTAKPELSSPFYGFGFFVHDDASGKQVSHGGDGRAVNCQFRSYLDSGYTYVVLSNTGPPGANIISDICQVLLAKMIEQQR
jgi:CubicO group peptidase (beta-lactamase class C family)